jgi:hypothetical protein
VSKRLSIRLASFDAFELFQAFNVWFWQEWAVDEHSRSRIAKKKVICEQTVADTLS